MRLMDEKKQKGACERPKSPNRQPVYDRRLKVDRPRKTHARRAKYL